MKSFILGFFLALIFLMPLRAQTATNAPIDTNSVTSSPTPASPAPDDVMKKISGLVHDGKYAEARQLTAGLLLAYPNDQRLIKGNALLDKLIAAQSANTSSSVSASANAVAPVQPVASTPSEQLTGMDKVEYTSLIELGREAQQTTDLDEQKTLLHRFMDKSKPFLEKHPNDLLLWQLRAASAMSLNDPTAGYEAGQKLLASGRADNDPNMQRLLSQLNLKGWLDKGIADEQKQREAYEKSFSWLLGTWSVTSTWKFAALVPKATETRGEKFVLAGSFIEGYEIKDAAAIERQIGALNEGSRMTGTPVSPDPILFIRGVKPDLRGTILDSEQIKWEIASHDPSGWSPIISCQTDKDQGTMKMLIDPTGKGSSKSKRPMTLLFKKGASQNQQAPISPPAEPRAK